MPEYDDATLEQVMREGLQARAEEAREELTDAPGSRAVSPGRGRWPAVAAAAAAVLVVAGAVVAGVSHHGPTGVATDTTGGGEPDDWRYESYDGVQVRVPPDWGWGGTPTGSGDQLTVCGDQKAAVVPDTIGAEPVLGRAFVGRPVMMSDACQGVDAAGAWPQGSAVWLGSPLPVGTDRVGDQLAETVAVGSQHVTVFARDDTLRSEILSTAEAVQTDGNGCPTEPVRRPSPGPQDDQTPDSLSVCVYDEGRLLWSGRSGPQRAQEYVDAFERSSATFDPAALCPSEPTGQWVAIGVHAGTTPARWDLADFACPALVGRYTYGQGKQSPVEAPLLPLTVAPWASGGIKAYVAGPTDLGSPTDEQLASYFRGMLG